ncbi:MAG: alpha/beta hydrolase [Succinivibrio sp.]|nr:alpha/beta hydrolase [Succinivibrio sp.]
MKKLLATAILCSALSGLTACSTAISNDTSEVQMTDKWDKTFKLSEKVIHSKVTFKTRFGTTIAADMYVPKSGEGKYAAIAVSGPFGAVKEQSSGLYAQTMAERGFLTIAFDPSFTGESSGTPRYMASPDINTEDFQAAVDYLSNLQNVDKERIGIIGICGWGGIALKAAAVDTRIKATVASTMYDMSRVIRNGYFDSEDSKEKRLEKLAAMNEQRTKDAADGVYDRDGGLPDVLPENVPQFVADYYSYYKQPRGYHERSVNSNGGWAKVSALSFMNTHLLSTIGEIDSPVMLVHGEKAHSRYFSETAFKQLKGDNKSLVIVPGANHVDLYDRTDVIPFNQIEDFFKVNLK